jgi:hypothetical protein
MRNIKTREAKKLRGSEIKRFSSSQLLVLWNFRVSDLQALFWFSFRNPQYQRI